ncbi:hypothetical protein AKO1_013948 [Acrasis kona]|uniref:Tyrosine-protein kinase ephrin type A/B receptor-like domain-containing protein n=1 Tax=Acrasis kona TaxID=1008807 RepID=A0AAW2Z479_9EUKA
MAPGAGFNSFNTLFKKRVNVGIPVSVFQLNDTNQPVDVNTDPQGNLILLNNKDDIPIVRVVGSNVTDTPSYSISFPSLSTSFCAFVFAAVSHLYAVCTSNNKPLVGVLNRCQGCPPGTWSNKTTPTCVDCVPGTYFNGTHATSPDFCIQCPAGTYSAISGASNISSCFQCPKGTYSDQKGSSSINNCTKCPAGMFNDKDGATSIANCSFCKTGYFSGEGSPVCQPCAYKMTSSILTNFTKCFGCPAGKYLNQTTKNCVNCSIYEFCPIGSVIPTNRSILPKYFFEGSKRPDHDNISVDPESIDFSKFNERKDLQIIIGTASVFALIFIVVLLIWTLLCFYRGGSLRPYMSRVDFLFYLSYPVEVNQPVVHKSTILGATYTLINLILMIGIAVMTIGLYINGNTEITYQWQVKTYDDLKGVYTTSLDFYTFDPEPSHCTRSNVNVDKTGFLCNGDEQVNVTLIDSVRCRVDWYCKGITFGYANNVKFSLVGNQTTTATCIAYNVSSPYEVVIRPYRKNNQNKFELRNGFAHPPDNNTLYKGITYIKIHAYFTEFEYFGSDSTLYFLPTFFLPSSNSAGLTLSGLSHVDGQVVNETFLSSSPTPALEAQVDWDFDAAVMTIRILPKISFSVFFGSTSGTIASIVTISTAIFPLLCRIQDFIETKIKARRKRNLSDLSEPLHEMLLGDEFNHNIELESNETKRYSKEIK